MARRSAEETRRHILKVAGDLFYARGVRAVGMDLVISRAEVANATLYRQFATKDDLVTAYLVSRNDDWWRHLRESAAAAPDARARIRLLFDLTRQDMTRPGYRGCATLNITSEFPDAEHPAHAAAVAHKTEVQEWLSEQLREAGDTDPEDTAGKLLVILDGAQVLAAAMGTTTPGDHMTELAEQLLEARLPAPGTGSR
ncbi:TetR/AcrR family transcriptional regulator [Streptomyces sp. ISL-12]|uniref:TetR/AcrR family transcriptional regulator n=1 Tax=Streptomyces sp. ISL-12 TaxID=2819177 RepID=UPI001BEB24D4|nr:TetR/AcrR family transcriptional regulator [Streptomyces sp. ISL-12]MBT2414724.1 TetR/AcrR family transcriptional regulator [Streptomyces sp. ISL-12]